MDLRSEVERPTKKRKVDDTSDTIGANGTDTGQLATFRVPSEIHAGSGGCRTSAVDPHSNGI